MGRGGRRPTVGVPRTPSGRKSRSAQARAIETITAEQIARERAAEEARRTASSVESSIATRARQNGLTPLQAASRHAESIEGRLFLRRVLTEPQAEAATQYRRVLIAYARETGAPAVPSNTLKRYMPGMPRPSGASSAIAELRYRDAQDALHAVGLRNPYAVWAIGQLCRRNQEPPERLWPALAVACQALAVVFGLDSNTDRKSEAL